MRNVHVIPSNREPVKGDLLLRHIWKNDPNECISWWRYKETVDIDKVRQYTTLNGSFRDIVSSFKVQNIYITVNGSFARGAYVTDGIEVIKATPKLVDAQGLVDRRNWKKIVLTSDPDLIADGIKHTGEEFLDWFVKNPNCDQVEAKHTTKEYVDDQDAYGYDVSYYKIIIPETPAKGFIPDTNWEPAEEISLDDIEEQESVEGCFLANIKYVLQFNNDAQAMRFMEKYYEAKKEQEGFHTDKDVINALHSVELKDNKNYSRIYEEMKKWFDKSKIK